MLQISTHSKKNKNPPKKNLTYVLKIVISSFFFLVSFLFVAQISSYTQNIFSTSWFYPIFLPLLIMVHALESLQIIVKNNQFSKLHGCKISINDAKKKLENKGHYAKSQKTKEISRNHKFQLHPLFFLQLWSIPCFTFHHMYWPNIMFLSHSCQIYK